MSTTRPRPAGLISLAGAVLFAKILPETKGLSLDQGGRPPAPATGQRSARPCCQLAVGWIASPPEHLREGRRTRSARPPTDADFSAADAGRRVPPNPRTMFWFLERASKVVPKNAVLLSMRNNYGDIRIFIRSRSDVSGCTSLTQTHKGESDQ
eukprot:1186284-Prorocentrum_minimum.AAC.1